MNVGEGSRYNIIRDTVTVSVYTGAENDGKLFKSCRYPSQNSNQVLSQWNSETSIFSIMDGDFDNYGEYYYDYE
jgi:hypothetical protein